MLKIGHQAAVVFSGLVLAATGVAMPASSAIIITDAVENNDGWSFAGNTANAAFVGAATSGLSPTAGVAYAKNNSSTNFNNYAFIKDFETVIQEGTYTFKFDVGDMNFSVFPGNIADRAAVGFFDPATLDGSGAQYRNAVNAIFNDSTTTYTVVANTNPSGGWQTWEYTLVVASGSPLIGKEVQFAAAFNSGDGGGARGVAFDNLSVSYVPEPGSLGLAGLGGLALLARRRA